MSDENETNDNTAETPNVKRMREQLEALQEQNDALNKRVRLSAFKEAGLDPDSGMGKAVYRTYEGEVSPEKIAAFAKEEYGWDPGPTAQISEGQQRMQQVTAAGNAAEARTPLQEAEEAAKQGDWIKSAVLKDQELFSIARKIR